MWDCCLNNYRVLKFSSWALLPLHIDDCISVVLNKVRIWLVLINIMPFDHSRVRPSLLRGPVRSLPSHSYHGPPSSAVVCSVVLWGHGCAGLGYAGQGGTSSAVLAKREAGCQGVCGVWGARQSLGQWFCTILKIYLWIYYLNQNHCLTKGWCC
jgi:hypothetical protein